MEKERVLELFAGLILVVFLFLLVFLVIGTTVSGKSSTTISNSYNGNTNSFNANSYNGNTNSFNSYPTQTRPAVTAYATKTQTTTYTTKTYSKPYIVDSTNYKKVYYYNNEDRYKNYEPKYYYSERYLRYDDAGRLRTYEGIVRNRVDSYEVYVRNREYIGGYFKTTFYMEDYYGRVDSQTVTYYIPAGEEKRFSFKDVSPPAYKYRTWWYDVDSLTKVPERTSSASYRYSSGY